MQLEAMEFLRRFLQHVLPKGMAKVRYYGFLASGAKKRFLLVRQNLRLLTYLKQQEQLVIIKQEQSNECYPCPKCGGTQLMIIQNEFHKKLTQIDIIQGLIPP